ncbi:MAG: hypothetical protein ABIG71_00090 [Candidatus Uhrbacteria bacterium]
MSDLFWRGESGPKSIGPNQLRRGFELKSIVKGDGTPRESSMLEIALAEGDLGLTLELHSRLRLGHTPSREQRDGIRLAILEMLVEMLGEFECDGGKVLLPNTVIEIRRPKLPVQYGCVVKHVPGRTLLVRQETDSQQFKTGQLTGSCEVVAVDGVHGEAGLQAMIAKRNVEQQSARVERARKEAEAEERRSDAEAKRTREEIEDLKQERNKLEAQRKREEAELAEIERRRREQAKAEAELAEVERKRQAEEARNRLTATVDVMDLPKQSTPPKSRAMKTKKTATKKKTLCTKHGGGAAGDAEAEPDAPKGVPPESDSEHDEEYLAECAIETTDFGLFANNVSLMSDLNMLGKIAESLGGTSEDGRRARCISKRMVELRELHGQQQLTADFVDIDKCDAVALLVCLEDHPLVEQLVLAIHDDEYVFHDFAIRCGRAPIGALRYALRSLNDAEMLAEVAEAIVGGDSYDNRNVDEVNELLEILIDQAQFEETVDLIVGALPDSLDSHGISVEALTAVAAVRKAAIYGS